MLKEIGFYGAIGFVILMIVAVPFSTSIIDPGERGVKVRNGEIAGEVGNGVQFAMPGTERIHVYDMRTSVYKANASALTKDDINADVSVTVRWNIKDGELKNVYKNTATSQEALVENAVRDAVIAGIKTSRQYNAENLSSEEYPETMKQEISRRFENRGLVVTSVTVDNIDYPPSVARKFRQQQEAQAEKKIAQQELEASRIDAKKRLVEAKNRKQVIENRSAALSPEYIRYIQAKNIDKSDTVYVVPANNNAIEMEKSLENTDGNQTAEP